MAFIILLIQHYLATGVAAHHIVVVVLGEIAKITAYVPLKTLYYLFPVYLGCLFEGLVSGLFFVSLCVVPHQCLCDQEGHCIGVYPVPDP